MLSSFLCCHLELSCGTGQSYIYYLKYLSIYSCCASNCILLLLLLCITQQHQAQLQQQQEKLNIKVFGKWYQKTYSEANNFYC